MLDPEIKRAWIWAGGPFHSRSLLVQRSGAVVQRSGERRSQPPPGPGGLAPREPVHRRLRSAGGTGGVPAATHDPQLALYNSFRTDRQAPARGGRIGTRNPSLAGDGGDLAGHVQTILEIGNAESFQAAIAAAFPGCRLTMDTHQPNLRLQLQQPGRLRPLEAADLSAGTLRAICCWRRPCSARG